MSRRLTLHTAAERELTDAALDIHRDTNSTRWFQDFVFSQARRFDYRR